MAMLPKTMDDLLSAIEQFHAGLAKHLTDCANNDTPEREQLLLHYLAGHEKKLANTVHYFRQNESFGPLNTWFYAYTDRHPITLRNPRETDFNNLPCSAICDEISNLHNQLIDLYQHIHQRAESESTRRVLADLLNIETSNTKLLARDAARADEM
jgi:hypothetical protein